MTKWTLRPLPALLFMLPALLTACSKEEKASEALAALEEEYSQASEALSEAQDSFPELSEDPDSAEMAAYRAFLDSMNLQFEELTRAFLPRYETLAEEHWGTGAGLEARIWAMSRASMANSEAGAEEGEVDPEEARAAREARIGEATEAIFEKYADSPHMEKLAENSYFFSEEQAEEYLGRLRENSPHANVRAAAIYYPASRKLSRLRIEELMGDRLPPVDADGEGGDEPEAASDPGQDGEAEAEVDPRAGIDADLQLIIDEYGDIPMGGSTYGAVAYAHLTSHSADDLAIGRPAPEIIGTDVDGNDLRLSQFLGKVVVIDFWGDW